MMKAVTVITLLVTTYFVKTAAWAPKSSAIRVETRSLSNESVPFSRHKANNHVQSLQQFDFPDCDENEDDLYKFAAPLASASILVLMPLPAAAATGDQIPSALAAYVHYLSLFAIVGLITFERMTVEAGMPKEKEMSLAYADIAVGISGIAVVVSGYYRATLYGKGWEFYSHEPIFWLKMVFLCIFGAATLFPTTTFIKRSVALQTGKELEPMSVKLASRLQQVLNAELVMVASIPLAATLMARGVGYTEALPFNIIGPALCAVTAGGLGFKYVKEALTWQED